MIRRPKFIQVAGEIFDRKEHADCIADDVLLFESGGVCFVGDTDMRQFLRPRRLAISRRHTQPHADPFHYFEPLFADSTLSVIASMNVDPRKPAVRELFPWLSAFWHDVEFCYVDNRIDALSVRFFRHTEPATAVLTEESLEALWRSYRAQNSVFQCIFVRWRTVDEERRFDSIAGRLATAVEKLHQTDQIARPFAVQAGRDAGVMMVPLTYMDKLRPILDGLKGAVEYLPPQTEVDITKLDQFGRTIGKPVPVKYAHQQWYGYHRHLLDLSIVLNRRLPTYVLLWVINWLPHYDQWNEHRKITLLHSIDHSLAAIEERRIEHPSSTRTNKDQ